MDLDSFMKAYYNEDGPIREMNNLTTKEIPQGTQPIVAPKPVHPLPDYVLPKGIAPLLSADQRSKPNRRKTVQKPKKIKMPNVITPVCATIRSPTDKQILQAVQPPRMTKKKPKKVKSCIELDKVKIEPTDMELYDEDE
jgi:hypothetical protein